MRQVMRIAVLAALLLVVRGAGAEDAFYQVPWGELEITEGALPTQNEADWRAWELRRMKTTYAVLDGEGEIYVTDDTFPRTMPPAAAPGAPPLLSRLVMVRTAAPRDVAGRLFVPTSDGKQMVSVRFKIPASRANRDARRTFFQLKKHNYDVLLAQDLPGAAWFRHESRQAQLALGEQPGDVGSGPTAGPMRGREPAGELADTYALFTGGRAMSENLQLDRVLSTAVGGEEAVELASLDGITVREIDWKPLVQDLKPELDPLAAKIPADQHAVFFPTFNAAVALSKEMSADGALVLEFAEARSASARTFDRYQEQLGLSITGLAELVGPSVVRSVALTGSDPYYRTGTDVAVLFEAVDATTLQTLLAAQISAGAVKHPGAQTVQGEVDGLRYQGVVTPDRTMCSYLAKADNVVVVTNSLYQLKQLASVTAGKTKALAALDEFTFFRNRYQRKDDGETALVFLSDATIRRWCGPRWRIATSRRTRDMAVMAEIQATHLDRLVAGKVESGPVYTDLPLGSRAELTLTPQGVVSATIGSLAFMTPIAEMDMQRVTAAEATAYRQWRDRYQQNWRWAFDPIGLRIGVKSEQLTADLTIMPLIWGTEYREALSISQGATIGVDAGDPHGALFHAILAINTKSEMLQRQGNFARMLAGGVQVDPIGWLGQSVSVYVDDGPFWDELAKAEPDARQTFMEEQGWRTPVAVRAEVSSGLKLTAFLAAVRGFIEQAAPGMLNWEALTYKDQPYVKITPTARAVGQTEVIRNLAVYYSASGKSLVITLNEDLIKQSIDRELERAELEKSGEEPRQALWLGSNLAMQVDQKILQVLAALSRSEYQRAMQTRAWSNLPILNVWKHRYPDQDPVALHERCWHTSLVCPGGGQYVWNEQWQTMESTVYGCPAAPREGPVAPTVLQTLKRGSFGVTFENQGLRARVQLDR
jgi:hypothetical protein